MSASVSQFRFAENRLYVKCRLKPESESRCFSEALFFPPFRAHRLGYFGRITHMFLLNASTSPPPSVCHPGVSGRGSVRGAIVLLGMYWPCHCAVLAMGRVCDASAFPGCDVLAIASFSPPHCCSRSACYSTNSNCCGHPGPNRCPCGTRIRAGARDLCTCLMDSLSASASGGIYSVEAPTGCLHRLDHRMQGL